jgi:predicted AlkP superfamily pyrophosphatase or phosphodiesterase
VLGAAPTGWQADGRGQSPSGPAPPKLVIVLVVDQMRADYVDRFQGDWTAGLKRLLTRGAVFSNAAYPYLTTVTCPGHATISSGAFPRLHGVFQNTWYDRESRRIIPCTADSGAKHVGYRIEDDSGASAARLLIPAFADELRAQRAGARVVALSLKARSAIMLAGHGGDAVTWLSESLEGWETSTAYSNGPVPAVKAFLDANSIDADFGRGWSRLLPASRYGDADHDEAERAPDGWTTVFPHVLNGHNDATPDEDFRDQWVRSPFADAFLGRFAAALVESLQLGNDDVTDFLGVGFSTPDFVGHMFGPRSQEVQDIYAHLDRTIGLLLDRLDTLVGRDRYLVAFTSDHGVAGIPEQLSKSGQDAGRVSGARLTDLLERTVQAVLGPGSYVSRVYGNDVYFQPGVYDKLAAMPSAIDAVMNALQGQPGIARVFRREHMLNGASSSDPLLRAAALSYVPRLSGDLVMALKPGWMYVATGTTHGSANPDDQRVPVILMGPGIRAGQYREAITPADVAPTLAELTGITMPRAEGRALRSALTSPPRSARSR